MTKKFTQGEQPVTLQTGFPRAARTIYKYEHPDAAQYR